MSKTEIIKQKQKKPAIEVIVSAILWPIFFVLKTIWRLVKWILRLFVKKILFAPVRLLVFLTILGVGIWLLVALVF